MQFDVESFFDAESCTYSYLVIDPVTRHCAIIDPVLDYDAAAARISYSSVERLIEHVRANALTLEWILETHVHADHLSAARYLKRQLGGQIGIGDRIPQVQKAFATLFDADDDWCPDGSQFDRLFVDNETFHVGALAVSVLHTPGHTPACVTYLIEDAAFVGDTLFMPDCGTARCDFPGGDAHQLYHSIGRLFQLPGSTRLFMCHDYKAPGRDAYCYQSTVDEERAHNIHIGKGIAEADFVALRSTRDKTLNQPRLLLPSVQINMRAGETPAARVNGISYLKIPLNMF
ncbi:MBL fold metallo-hydrolase [Pseudomonas sp. PDM26]|uniref:MBL fold metallo-hydrolase n=1 Tax=Pseudomonas sp. PDM26 TaxID=2854766 RepID=UPI001C452AF5|nr:MBL fold metallo-hydrolase [Pseudomonas sp. PDM26]MBV7546430.1 MBL fold metallo-hydrolase [Pseudomonas sp. PDM26]